MPKLSTRTLYLFLAFSITLLFAGTGIYYLLTVSKAPLEENSTEQSGQRIIAKVSPSPTPTYTPQLEPEKNFEASVSSQTKESSKSAQTLDLSCHEPCSYDYQCPANLSCVELGKEKVCLNPDCPSDQSCLCSQNFPAIGGVSDEEDFTSYPEEDFSEEEEELASYSQETFELENYDVSPTQTPTPKSIASPSSSPKSENLPQAGNFELTFALLALGIGVILTSSSLLKRN